MAEESPWTDDDTYRLRQGGQFPGSPQNVLANRAADEIERLRARTDPMEGHDKPCYYCQKPCNGLAGNPSEWPVALCHPDNPGRVKWHHVGCVSDRLHGRVQQENGTT